MNGTAEETAQAPQRSVMVPGRCSFVRGFAVAVFRATEEVQLRVVSHRTRHDTARRDKAKPEDDKTDADDDDDDDMVVSHLSHTGAAR